MSTPSAALFEEAGTLFIPSHTASHSLSVETLSQMLPQDARLFTLRCHFDEEGPWGGMRDLFRELLAGLDSEAPDLLARHDYELVHVLPHLKATLGIRNPSLTDLASNEERVRNYPADRALRIVHGLIDLLIAVKERCPRKTLETWILLCLDYGDGGHIAQTFFQELMRRAGKRLRLVLLPVLSGSQEPGFPPSVPRKAFPFGIEAPERNHQPEREQAAELAKAVEAEVGDDALLSTARIPDLINLFKIAECPQKVFEWQSRALYAFNTLGLYADAIRYGEQAREYCKQAGYHHSSPQRLTIFFKLFMCYLGVSSPETALALALEDVPDDCEGAKDPAMQVNYCYVMAMLHARYLPVRDSARGERYLELGLKYLDGGALQDDKKHFMYAFNRNGLAMIRSFQGRHQEALDMCRAAWELLVERLDPGQHHLHKSVLIYNMAQVYYQTGAFDLAIEHYTAAMRMDPNYSEYYNERGNLLLKLGRLEEAETDYRCAISLGPPYFEVWANLGQCCRLLGRMEEAVTAYERSLDLHPNQPMAWVVRAQALEALGRLDEAIASYGEALNLQPGLWPALAGRAVLLYEQGQINECLADLDRAVELAPDEPEIYQNRAVARVDLGLFRGASHDLRRYLELRPDADDRAEVETKLREISPALATATAP